MIRKPIIAVLGHVDHGKTLLLDSIRGTTVADKEAGKITQHVGATEVPKHIIDNISGELLTKFGFSLKIPGLLFIDTPGHEAFTSLRKRGGSIADLAVLVVDINQGFQPQTLEAINILKTFKVPFIVAANKIDVLYGYDSKDGSFLANLKQSSQQAKDILDQKIYELVGKLYEQGFQSERFDRIEDFAKQISIVPISAKTKEGIPELLMLLSGLSQKFLEKKLEIKNTEIGRGTVLEVKKEKGLGFTLDVVLYEGFLNIGQKILVVGKNGLIETNIRCLLIPKPLTDMKSNEKFNQVKEVIAAAGVKISAPNLDEALPGFPVVVFSEETKKELLDEVEGVELGTSEKGIMVKADTLGSLEAMVNLLNKENISIKSATIGDISKKDILEAFSFKEADLFDGVILGFNVKVDDDVKAEAKKQGVLVLTNIVIYKLVEDFVEWKKKLELDIKQKESDSLTFPCRFIVLRNHIFRNNKPAIVGVRVLEGFLKSNLVVINSEGKQVGKISGIQIDGENKQRAEQGQEVALSIDGAVVGRNLFEEQELFVRIPEKHKADVLNFLEKNNASLIDLYEETVKAQNKAKEVVA